MAKTELSKSKTNTKKTKIEDERTSLKGTLASVFLLGLFLIVTWLGVYFLFMDRL